MQSFFQHIYSEVKIFLLSVKLWVKKAKLIVKPRFMNKQHNRNVEQALCHSICNIYQNSALGNLSIGQPKPNFLANVISAILCMGEI